jgi:hypothetical protein
MYTQQGQWFSFSQAQRQVMGPIQPIQWAQYIFFPPTVNQLVHEADHALSTVWD